MRARCDKEIVVLIRRERKTKSRKQPLRPTSSKTKSAIVSMLGPSSIAGKKVLELYAGTGYVGISLLQLGAAQVDFVEIVRAHADDIRSSIESLGYKSATEVHQMDALSWLSRFREKTKYHIVFADPPYDIDPSEAVLERLHKYKLLEPDAWVIFEHSARHPLPDTLAGATAIKQRRYGDSAITIYSFR